MDNRIGPTIKDDLNFAMQMLIHLLWMVGTYKSTELGMAVIHV